MNEFTITKQIAKHGDQRIIVLPKSLHNHLQVKALVEVRIKILEEEKR